jgi:antitoxin CptB
MSDEPLADVPAPSETDIRRRRIKIRAWRRGLRELDILMGGFVDARVDSLSLSELAETEELLELQDTELLSWLSGVEPPPPERDTALFRAIVAFHTHEGPIH